MYDAMKAREKVKSNALRTALSKIKDKQIEKKEPLNDDEIIKVLRAIVKQRDESIKLYNDAGRVDLADNEKLEKKYLETYLPKMLSNEEVAIIVETVIKDLNADSINDIGKIMPVVMKRGKGLVDGNFARQIVVSLLSK
tara:strand:+ start:123 stop:539 length:417 start_codon:yes stop_codon:yes gene_type:complete